VEKKLDIKSIQAALPVVGLVLLLLLSPCKVRHFIQAELGVPQTQVLNKSQTSLGQSNCNSAIDSTILAFRSTPRAQQTQALLAIFSKLELASTLLVFPHRFAFSHASKIYAASPIPLYILYHRFKNYL